jgi:hypothetical protein
MTVTHSSSTFSSDRVSPWSARICSVLKIWSIGGISDSIELDGFGAKACGSQGFSNIDDRLKRLSDLVELRSGRDFEPFSAGIE